MSLRRLLRGGWVLWSAMLVLATVVLVQVRSSSDQAHATLILLLVVLGGSAAGGRALGFALACAGFGVIDYYLQPPYGYLSVNKPLDGLILLAFFATAAVTTELLARARHEAELARQRANEVASLAALGAATLRHARPADALDAISLLVCETLGAVACTTVPIADVALGDDSIPANATVEEAAAIALLVKTGQPVLQRDRAVTTVTELERGGPETAAPLNAHVVALPLRAEGRVIGVLLVRGDPDLTLDPPRRRFLAALGYYAAIAIERMRLLAEASRSEALREADRAKDQVLASVSHDLRTPLTTIKVLAQAAESRGEPAAPAIVEQVDRLARMVADLLELSRLRAGATMHAPELNTAEDVVGAALARVAGILGDREIVPHVDLESPALVGEFDFVHTLRILANLLENALRFTAPHGVVDLYVEREQDVLAFAVADRGPGVPSHEEHRIFDAFYRPSGATPDSGHAGLGLSIARTLAELQQGTLSYEPRQGGGSVFTLRLPAADVAVAAAADVE